MKPNHPTTATNESKTNSFVILAGIVIAFICSFVIFENAHAAEREREEAIRSESIATSLRLTVASPRIEGITGVVSIFLPR